MRQILFRGKRIDNSEWIEGDLCNFFTSGKCIMPSSYYATREFDEPEEGEMPNLQDGFAIGEWFTVIPETVGQFTGLPDKNGNKIFEGDKGVDNFGNEVVVKFSDGCYWLCGLKEEYGGVPLYVHCDESNGLTFEITGNIHDNG